MDSPSSLSPCLPDQVRERLRYKHYSLSIEELYFYWIRFFIHMLKIVGGVQRLLDVLPDIAQESALRAAAPWQPDENGYGEPARVNSFRK